MIVKHEFAGWIGVVRNGVCANGTVEFVTSMFGTSQLKEHKPTESEKRRLLEALLFNKPHLSSHITEVRNA
jgi:hypothetical protein